MVKKKQFLALSGPLLLVVVLLLAAIDFSAGWGWSSSNTDATDENVDAPATQPDSPMSVEVATEQSAASNTDPPKPVEAAVEESAVGKGDEHNVPAEPIQEPDVVSPAEDMSHTTSSTVEVTSGGDSLEIRDEPSSLPTQEVDNAEDPQRKNVPTSVEEPELRGNGEDMVETNDCRLADLGTIMVPETWTPPKEFATCTSLHLDFKDVNDEMAAKLSNVIASHANLGKFSTVGDTPKLTKVGWAALSKAIGKNPRLTEFTVENNEQIDAISTGAIARELLETKNGIRRFDFSGTTLSTASASEIADSLSKATPGIEILVLSRTHMGARGGVQIGKAIKRHPTLKELHLDNNLVGDKPVVQLAKKLQTRKAPKIEILNLSEMNLSVNSMEELSKAIAFSPNLKELDLTGNFRISPSGAKVLANGVKANKSLRKIVARYCDLGDEGIFALVDAVMEHGNIEHLDIMWNNMSNKGSAAIAMLLKVNRKLKYLNIQKNKLDTMGMGEIAAAMENNFVIQEVIYQNNRIHTDSRIDSLLTRNRRGKN